MRKIFLTVCLVGIFCLAAHTLLAAGKCFPVPAGNLLQTPAVFPSNAPLFLTSGPCTVSRDCDDLPTIFCSSTSPTGSCSSGPEDGGWVDCGSGTKHCNDDDCESCSASWQCVEYCQGELPNAVTLQSTCQGGCCACADTN